MGEHVKYPDVPERFEVLDEIASSHSEVLLYARDRPLLREVILKLPVQKPLAVWPEGKEQNRELREARALAKVRHPGVIHLLDVIPVPAGLLQVIESVAGENLKDKLTEEGVLPPQRVRELGMKLAEAMDALEKDHEFLTKGRVFTDDLIQTWIEYKREHELHQLSIRPHPYEFFLYYDN